MSQHWSGLCVYYSFTFTPVVKTPVVCVRSDLRRQNNFLSQMFLSVKLTWTRHRRVFFKSTSDRSLYLRVHRVCKFECSQMRLLATFLVSASSCASWRAHTNTLTHTHTHTDKHSVVPHFSLLCLSTKMRFPPFKQVHVRRVRWKRGSERVRQVSVGRPLPRAVGITRCPSCYCRGWWAPGWWPCAFSTVSWFSRRLSLGPVVCCIRRRPRCPSSPSSSPSPSRASSWPWPSPRRVSSAIWFFCSGTRPVEEGETEAHRCSTGPGINKESKGSKTEKGCNNNNNNNNINNNNINKNNNKNNNNNNNNVRLYHYSGSEILLSAACAFKTWISQFAKQMTFSTFAKKKKKKNHKTDAF